MLEYYRKALSLSEELIPFDDPTKAVAQRSVAMLHQRIGTRLNNWGNQTQDAEKYRQAIEQHRQALAGWESLSAARPDDTSIRLHIADELIFIGISQSNLGENQEALENYRKAQPIIETLIAKDLTNAEFRYEEVFLEQETAVALEQTGDISRAIQTYRQAIRISEELRAANPTRIIENYDSLKSGYKEVSELLEKQGDIRGAIENRRKELEIIEKYLDISPGKAKLRREQANVEAQLGNLSAALAVMTKSSSQRQEHWREARTWYQHSLEKWQEIRRAGTLNSADAGKPGEVSTELAKCAAALGQ